jgi:uncharacterized glyoxalase superfamily protein PhnB
LSSAHCCVDRILRGHPDRVFQNAVKAGATVVFPPADTPWGGRWARVQDKWRNSWTFTTPALWLPWRNI